MWRHFIVVFLFSKYSSSEAKFVADNFRTQWPGGDTRPVHVTGDMEKYLTTEATKDGLGGFNKQDLIAATFAKKNEKGMIFFLGVIQLEFIFLESSRKRTRIFRRLQSTFPVLWTLVVTLRLFFLYFAKINLSVKERRRAAGYVGTQGGVGWSNSPLPWKSSWSLFISLCFSVNVTAWFNNQAYHAIAVSLAAADAGILRSVLGKNVSLTTINHPLPRTAQEAVNDLQR